MFLLDGIAFLALIFLAVYLVVRTLIYFAFIHSFRYRVSAVVPMSIKVAFKLTIVRTLLEVLIFGGSMWVLKTLDSRGIVYPKWVLLYPSHAIAWWLIGSLGSSLRGRAMLGWVLFGLTLDAAIDTAVAGIFGPIFSLIIVLAIVAFLIILNITGKNKAHRARFSGVPLCAKCFYNLTGNVSGKCPECGTVIDDASALV